MVPPQFDSSSESSDGDAEMSEDYIFGYDDPWTLGEVSEKMDMSDLWVVEDTVPLADIKGRKYSINKHR